MCHRGRPQAWTLSTLLVALVCALGCALVCPGALADGLAIDPASMARIGTIDARFQSYNIEMVEVTGGRFWKPYGPKLRSPLGQARKRAAQAGPNLYGYRAPIDLANPRLR